MDFDLRPFGTDDPVPQIAASHQGVLRLGFEFLSEGAELAELTAVLNDDAAALTETWLLRWTRD